MKATNAFQHPVSGENVMPGQTFDEKGMDKDQIEDLKKRGYLADGDGYKAGEKVDFEKLSIKELQNYGSALGIDTGPIRTRDRLVSAINAREAAKQPPKTEGKRAVLTFGPGAGGASVKEETVSPEDQAKRNEETDKARAEHEASIRQSGEGDKRKAAPPERKSTRGETGSESRYGEKK